eukprot:TRINITY_DN50625_c0_g1_i1.p1 TRINITY_DN50625_c0_g1~~TRINITY_DN50625_c0_g1_i1.p1  ORF type:complete len:284 (+),score=57.47 TRINITY_DN50625_c0_g1_i1:204-1055(+)
MSHQGGRERPAADVCRWAMPDNVPDSAAQLVDLPPSEQVARGKELLSLLQDSLFTGSTSASENRSLPPTPSDPSSTPPAPLQAVAHFGRADGSDSGSSVGERHWYAGQLQTGPATNGDHVAAGAHHRQQQAAMYAAPHQYRQPAVAATAYDNSGGYGWGSNGGAMGSSPATGSWAPLSTNPAAMGGNCWLSTGMQAAPSVQAGGASCTPAVAAENTGYRQGMNGWTHAPGLAQLSPTEGSDSTAAAMQLQGQANAQGADSSQGFYRPQLRAEAAPYVPGVPAY